MALYRTERRLSWNQQLSISYWSAPWSLPLADTGSDYVSRALRWLRSQYPKAAIQSCSHALPALSENWPEGRFGLETADSVRGTATGNSEGTPAHAADTANAFPDAPDSLDILAPLDDTDATADTTKAPRTADLLLVEWPTGITNAEEQEQRRWVNGLERALRRHWQENPEAEVLLIAGPGGFTAPATALARHYGIESLDPLHLLTQAAEPPATDGLCTQGTASTTASPALTDKG